VGVVVKEINEFVEGRMFANDLERARKEASPTHTMRLCRGAAGSRTGAVLMNVVSRMGSTLSTTYVGEFQRAFEDRDLRILRDMLSIKYGVAFTVKKEKRK
jgi:hypothetical protein